MSEIDVSKCRLLNSLGICASPINSKCKLCVEISEKNCYYKQLKRKEQECEALRMSENEAVEIIAELKAENDTLRQFLSKEPLALQALQSAYSSYKKSADVFYEMIKQYKQTLAEIKEIAETISLPMGTGKSSNRVILAKQILQKISEAENE